MLGLLRYYGAFKRWAGRSLDVLILLMFVGGLTEGVGVALLLPFLDLITSSRSDQNLLGQFLYGTLRSVGLQPSAGTILGCIFGLIAVVALVKVAQEVLSAHLMAEMLRRIRERLLHAYSDMHYTHYLRSNAGYLSNVMVRETEQVVSAFGQYANIAAASAYLVIYVVASLALDWTLCAVAAGGGLVLAAGVRVLAQVSSKYSALTSEESGAFQQYVIQFLQYFKYLKATHTFPELNAHLTEQIARLSQYRFRLSSAGAIIRSLSEPVAALFVIALLLFQVSVLGRTPSQVLVMVLLFYRIIQKLLVAQNAWQTFCTQTGSVDLFDRALTEIEAQREDLAGAVVPRLSQGIEFRRVSCEIAGAPILRELTLMIPAGHAIAIVGESGAGKSTLVDLVTGVLRPSSGEVLVDGTDLHALDRVQWRRQIGYVTQENVVFHDSIANNISLWRPAEAGALQQVAAAAHLGDVVGAGARGFEAIVGDRGITLSGGQRQRIALARELYKRPQLLILDEATSALDSETEKRVQERIEQLKGQVTLIVIAHRLSTIRNCDYLYVLGNGRIIEHGTYDELLASPGSRLARLVHSQSAGAAVPARLP